MDKDEFIKQRCKIENITNEMFERTYRVVKCDCGMPYCKGYRCLDIDDLYNELKKKDEVIEKAIEYVNNNLMLSCIIDGKKYYCLNDYTFDYAHILQILEDKEVE